eukprot:Rmarinus@m.23081
MPESGATKARPTQLASVPPNPTKRSSSEGEGKPSTKTKNPVKLTPLGGVQDKSQELPPHVKQSVERLTHVDYFYVHRNDGKAIRYGSGPRVPLRAYKSTSDLKKNYYISATHTDIANALKLSYPPKMFYRTPPLEKILLEDVQPGDDVIVSTGEALHPAYREENDDDVDAAADTRIFQIIDVRTHMLMHDYYNSQFDDTTRLFVYWSIQNANSCLVGASRTAYFSSLLSLPFE